MIKCCRCSGQAAGIYDTPQGHMILCKKCAIDRPDPQTVKLVEDLNRKFIHA